MEPFQTTGARLIALLFGILGLVPRKPAWVISGFLGRLWFNTDARHQRIILDNLRQAYAGEKNERDIHLLAKAVYRNIIYILFEIGWSLRTPLETYRSRFQIHGFKHYRNAAQKGRGVICLTAHIGNWELLTVAAALCAFKGNVLYRPLDFAPMEEFIVYLRTRFGNRLIPRQGSLRKVLRSLRRGESVAFLLDQNVGWRKGVFVDFFGRRACTNKGLALLALRTGAPVIPFFVVREGQGYKALFLPEVTLQDTGDKTRDIEDNTQQFNHTIETMVRTYPDQWFWIHQRWKTKAYRPWPRQV